MVTLVKWQQPNDNQQSAAAQGPVLDSVRLAFIASAVTTLGDLLATMAAALAIQEAQASETQNHNGSLQDIEKQIRHMQKQLDYLTNQLSKK